MTEKPHDTRDEPATKKITDLPEKKLTRDDEDKTKGGTDGWTRPSPMR